MKKIIRFQAKKKNTHANSNNDFYYLNLNLIH